MPRTGHTLHNPVSGHQVTFLQTAEQTGGQLLQIEYTVTRPEKPEQFIPLHLHSRLTERFTVTSGQLGVLLGKEKAAKTLSPGELVEIPPGMPHAFWNAGQESLTFLTDVEPAGQLQTYWETVFGLAADGKVNQRGVPNIWQIAVLFPVMDTYLPTLPIGVQDALFSVLATIGRLLGYRDQYPRYSEV